MGFLSDFSKFRAERARDRTFDRSASLLRTVRQRTASGGVAEEWTQTGSFSCRVRRPRRVIVLDEVAGQLQAVSNWEILAAPEVDVRPLDRIVIGEATFGVIGADGARSSALVQVISCELIGR